MGAWISREARGDQDGNGTSLKRVRELEAELEEQQKKARMLEDEWKKASEALATVSVKLANANETILQQTQRLQQLEGREAAAGGNNSTPAGGSPTAPTSSAGDSLTSEDSLAEAKPKRARGRPRKNPIPVKKIIEKKSTPSGQSSRAAGSKTPVTAAKAAKTPGRRFPGRPKLLPVKALGLKPVSDKPQRPLQLLQESDVSEALVGRLGERYWAADKKWYVFRVEEVTGRRKVLLRYVSGEIEDLTLADAIPYGQLSLIAP